VRLRFIAFHFQARSANSASSAHTTPNWSSSLPGYGVPRQDRGVLEVPGLHFLGLPWLHTFVSATLEGMGLDARYLAERMGLIGAAEADPLSV
jgi:hypothetical protein